MDIRSLQRQWDALARADAFGAILIDPSLDGPWDAGDFFARGELEIASLVEYAERLGLPTARLAVLDFGCGVGRLTQALADRFDQAVGVDVAPSMIELAEGYNRHGDRCRYILNERPDLACFEACSFDLVYSNLTLQHMTRSLAEGYIGELVRVLRPGGLLVFQLTSGLEALPADAYRASLELVDRPGPLLPDASTTVRVLVRNESSHLWPATFMVGEGGHSLMVGNHWRDRLRRVAVQDDGRSLLPSDVAPGETVEVALTVTAPAKPGRYVLEIDLVQQDVAWFADHGSKTARSRVQIARHDARAAIEEPATPNGSGGLEDGCEMHFVPKASVLEVLAAAGGELIEIVPDESAGRGWISLRYAATR